MHSRVRFLVTALALAGLCPADQALGRQNIVLGEMTVGYDFQDRRYEQSDTDGVDVIAVPGQPAVPVVRVDDREGDTRDLFFTPRIRLRSEGHGDLVEFSYAPTFTYDDIDSSNFTGHDFNLLAEKNLSQTWLLRATNSYFYGEDPVRDSELRSAEIVPGQEAPAPATVGAGPQEGTPGSLTETYGRQLYWRNDFGLNTDYTYADDSVFGVEYNFGLLRPVDEDRGGDYTPYDRHEGILRLTYRFNIQWQVVADASYVKGIYDDTELIVIRPPEEQTVPEPTDTETTTTPAENLATTSELSDDLQEYHGRIRTNYAWNPHDIFFGQYSYVATDYQVDLSEDSAIHELTVGWDHDFSGRVRTTLSGGPTFITYDRSSDETGYNAFAGLVWEVSQYGSANANTSYGYEYENFDGQRSGLTKTWRTELGYSYRFTEALQADLSAGYENRDLDQPRETGSVVVVDAAALAEEVASSEDERFQYNEDSFDAGLALNYTFLQWFTVSASYRYYDFQSENEQDYDEHRVLLTLTAAKELFRW